MYNDNTMFRFNFHETSIDYVYCALQYRIKQLPDYMAKRNGFNQLANSFGSTKHLSLINYIKTVSLRSELFKM